MAAIFLEEGEEMPRKYIPKTKMSKKEQRAEHAKNRRGWNGISPVTRVTPNRKAYSRIRAKEQMRKDLRDD